MSIHKNPISILSITNLMLVMVNALNCDFGRLEMEQCFIDYYSAYDNFTEADPICNTSLTRLARVQLCVKVWEKAFFERSSVYMRPSRDSCYLGRIQTPTAEWNFRNACVRRKVTFIASGIEHEDMVAGVFECPMRELQFDGFPTMSNFYISYGGESDSVFYFHEVLDNLALQPKVDETGMIILKIAHWVNRLDRIPDLSLEQLVST